MSYRTFAIPAITLIALLALACGGGGGGGGGTDLTNPGNTTPVDTAPAQLVVVQYDYDQDGEPDLLTLNRSTSPLTIVEALSGTADGEMTDMTAAWAGNTVAPEISDAVSAHLADSVEVAGESQIQATDGAGGDVLITVYE